MMPLAPLWLGGIAAALIIIELIFFPGTFVMMWFGAGFAATALIHALFPALLGHWALQSALAAAVGLILLLLLRKRFIDTTPHPEIEAINTHGIGIVKGEFVEYSGTLWRYDAQSTVPFPDGTKVEVMAIDENRLTVRELQP